MSVSDVPGPYELEGSVKVVRRPVDIWAWQNPSRTAPQAVRLPSGQVYVWAQHWLVKDDIGWRVLAPSAFETLYGQVG